MLAGVLGEYFVALIYMSKFYSILHHRLNSYVGEIDLIAKRGRTIVFIEVKTRKSGISEGIISKRQIDRIRNAAELFVSHNSKYSSYDIRFDLVVVSYSQLPRIIQNAW